MIVELLYHRRKLDNALHGLRRVVVHCRDLGASATCRDAFLPKPSAFGPDLTLGQLIDDCRQYLNNSSGQAAVGAVKMRTSISLACRCEAEDFRWLSRTRHSKHIWRCRKRLIEIRDIRSAGSVLNDAEHAGAFHPRLRTRAE